MNKDWYKVARCFKCYKPSKMMFRMANTESNGNWLLDREFMWYCPACAKNLLEKGKRR